MFVAYQQHSVWHCPGLGDHTGSALSCYERSLRHTQRPLRLAAHSRDPALSLPVQDHQPGMFPENREILRGKTGVFGRCPPQAFSTSGCSARAPGRDSTPPWRLFLGRWSWKRGGHGVHCELMKHSFPCVSLGRGLYAPNMQGCYRPPDRVVCVCGSVHIYTNHEYILYFLLPALFRLHEDHQRLLNYGSAHRVHCVTH